MADRPTHTNVFRKNCVALTSPQWRYISNRGGTRSSKTYSVLQLLHFIIPQVDRAGDVTSVVSETLPHLKRGAIRDFEGIVGHPLKSDKHWNASECVYTYNNGAKLEFFSVDSPGKVQGPARKRLFCNECNHISWEIFLQLDVRTTGVVFLDYNPCAAFWCTDVIEARGNCTTINSTYKDNDFLTKEQVEAIEANRSNKQWLQVYGEGKIGTLEGVVYDFEQIDALPEGNFPEVWGIDFGFTNDPTAIVRIKADTGRKIAYIQQVAYRTRMLNADIARELTSAGVQHYEVFADCAEPKSITEIARSGINIRPCDKGAPTRSEKLKFQIQWMKGWQLKVTKDSVDIIRELRNYVWAKDASDRDTGYPIDTFNHSLDAIRYAMYSKFGKAGSGEYSFSFARTTRR